MQKAIYRIWLLPSLPVPIYTFTPVEEKDNDDTRPVERVCNSRIVTQDGHEGASPTAPAHGIGGTWTRLGMDVKYAIYEHVDGEVGQEDLKFV